MERVAVDVLGPLTRTHNGNEYVLVVVDYFSKWMEAYPIEDQQAETAATELVQEFVCRFGVPLSLELHSDQGRNFESSVFNTSTVTPAAILKKTVISHEIINSCLFVFQTNFPKL